MKTPFDPNAPKKNILALAIQSPNNPLKNIESYVEEFYSLISSSGRKYQHKHFIKLREIDPTYFITKGKLQEILEICTKNNIEEVIISEPLSIKQERSLASFLNCEIVDRTLLILDIFERGAHSSEGQKQVALARLQYEKAHLAGRGIEMSQQSGRIGTRGPGETQKEKDIQHIERLMSKIKKDLKSLEQTRETQRKQRLKSEIPLFCLIGYTNAGKSTILNALTKSEVLAENKLFSTLDTTTKELYIDGKKKALIEDTVGFIQQLPHHLIEAFKSTLKELEYANLLIQVIDVSDLNWQEHCIVVQEVLKELNVEKPMLFVFNKIDKIEDLKKLEPQLNKYQPNVTVSALTLKGLEPLINFLRDWQK